MISKTLYIVSFILVSSMLLSQCASSITWVLSSSDLAQIEHIDFTNKTSEKNESSETDVEDDTKEELIIIHSYDYSSKLELENESCHIDECHQSMYLDVKGIPPELS